MKLKNESLKFLDLIKTSLKVSSRPSSLILVKIDNHSDKNFSTTNREIVRNIPLINFKNTQVKYKNN